MQIELGGGLLELGAGWCTLVQIGADWCNMVPFREMVTLVQLGAHWFNLVKSSAALCTFVQLRAN